VYGGVWVPEEAAQANGLGAKEGKGGKFCRGFRRGFLVLGSNGKEGLKLKKVPGINRYKEEEEEHEECKERGKDDCDC